MRSRYLIAVGAILLAVVGVTIAQQQQPKSTPTIPGPTTPPQADLPPPRATVQPSPAQDPLVVAPQPRHTKPEDLTIEQLIEAVDGFREQKAELEKKEKAYLKVLYKKAEKLKERIDGLGGEAGQSVLPPENVPPPVRPATPLGPTPP